MLRNEYAATIGVYFKKKGLKILKSLLIISLNIYTTAQLVKLIKYSFLMPLEVISY